MYNQEIKERFLREGRGDLRRGDAERYFNVSGDYEKKIGKDLSEMSKDEAMSMLNQIDFYEPGTANNYVYGYKSYVRWCYDNSIFQSLCDSLLDVVAKDVDPSVSMARMFFRDEQDLFHALRKVRPLNQGHTEVVAAVFLWLGIDVRDALLLREENVDLENRVITDPNGSVLVDGFSDMIHDFLKQYSECRSGIRGPREVVVDRTHDRFIKRFTTPNSSNMGKPLRYENVRTDFAKMNQAYADLGYELRLNPTNVLRSGFLRKLFELEQSGVDLEAKESRPLVESVYKKSYYLRIIWQYKLYKKAFNL